MQHLSEKRTDKSKWTYCGNRPWRSFDSGPPYSHWDTWWRENKTQRGRVKDTEGKEGGKNRIKGRRERTQREEGKEGDIREQRGEGLETAQSTNYRHHCHQYDITTMIKTSSQTWGSCDGGAGSRRGQMCSNLQPLSHTNTDICKHTHTNIIASD